MTRQVRASAHAWGGAAAWEGLLASVSPACRERFSHAIGYYDWVESPLALELHEAWAKLRGLDDMGPRGEAAAQEIFGSVQRWILSLASPAFLLQNIPRVYGFYYRGGQMKLVRLGAREADLEFRASGYPELWFQDGLPSAMRVALDLTGMREPEVQHSASDPEGEEPFLHRYRVSWRP